MKTYVHKITTLLPYQASLLQKANRIERILNKKRMRSKRKISVKSRIALIQATAMIESKNNNIKSLTYSKKSTNNILKTSQDKLRVAVDVDEVLGQFLVCLNNYCSQKFDMNHTLDEYHVYHFATIWGCSEDLSKQIVHSFLKSESFCQGIPPLPGAKEVLEELSQWCELMIVTSRQEIIRDVTVQWISTNFPGIFSEIYFGNHYAYNGKSKKKSEICREIKADVLIDDNPCYASECASCGLDVILYNWQNQYAWSKMPNEDGNSYINTARDWNEVKKLLIKIFVKQFTNQNENNLILT